MEQEVRDSNPHEEPFRTSKWPCNVVNGSWSWARRQSLRITPNAPCLSPPDSRHHHQPSSGPFCQLPAALDSQPPVSAQRSLVSILAYWRSTGTGCPCWCHLPDLGDRRRSHSRESGNPACLQRVSKDLRSGLPLSRE